MKAKRNIFIALFGALILGLTGCNGIEEPDPNMGVNEWTISKAAYDNSADAVTRARVHFYVSGYHELPYGFSYTIDGQPGTGSLALHRIASGDDGSDLLTLAFDGNCPSGTPLDIPCHRVNNHTMQYHGGAYFLMPLLEPGTHTFVATITNEYGQTIETTKTFEVEAKK